MMPPRLDKAGKPVSKVAMSLKGEATAQRILDAAYKTIAVRGCGAVTLQHIADEAGGVVSQPCYYFGNKNSLLAAVLKRAGKVYLEGLGRWLCHDGAPAEQIIDFVNYNEFILRDSTDTYRIFLEFCNYAVGSTDFQSEIASTTSNMTSRVEAVIANRGPRRNPSAKYPSASVIRFIFSTSLGIALQHFLSPDNKGMRKEFEVIREVAVKLVEADIYETSER